MRTGRSALLCRVSALIARVGGCRSVEVSSRATLLNLRAADTLHQLCVSRVLTRVLRYRDSILAGMS